MSFLLIFVVFVIYFMIIKNFEKLATSNLRRQLLSITEEGYKSINTTEAVKKAVRISKNRLIVQNKEFLLNKFNRIFVFAFGKAALESSDALKAVLGDRVFKGLVIDVAQTPNNTKDDGKQNNWIYFQATHPNVSEQNVKAAKETLKIINELKEDDLVICSISGGGSAIFEIPYNIDFELAAKIFKVMTKGGATIAELNTVRKHTSLVKGGQLAKHFYPATIINLVFSDVPGDDLSVIASGPLVKDKTTVRDAHELLQKFDVLRQLKLNKIELIETPKEDMFFKKITNFLVVSPKVALRAMKERAEVLGYEVKIYDDRFQGEARVIGSKAVEASKKGQCVLGAGESTVKILGQGKGGRNQEMALSALLSIGENQVFGSFASDGHDFTDCAGAIVDSSTKLRANNLGLNISGYLNNNDSFTFFEAVGDHVITGLTGSNIADFFVCLKT